MISIEEMRSQLLTLDDVKARLEPTEHLSQFDFTTDGNDTVKFNFPDGWAANLDLLDETDITIASVDINGTQRSLTKQASVQAITTAHLSQKFAQEVPGELVGLNLDYWATHSNKRFKMLAGPDTAVAFTRDTISPFSNIELLDRVVEGIQEKYQTEDILVDYKFYHDLKQTTLRLIVPSQYRNIASLRTEEAGNDPWSVGVELRNSVIGASSTQIHGYLFAWWCTNGATTTHVTSGKYRRRPTADPNDVYDWARLVVDDVLGGLEGELNSIQDLTNIPLEGDLNETLGIMFDRFSVPVRTREAVLTNLAETNDFSAYGLQAAITAVANDSTLTGATVDSLLSAGGKLAHELGNRCELCHKF